MYYLLAKTAMNVNCYTNWPCRANIFKNPKTDWQMHFLPIDKRLSTKLNSGQRSKMAPLHCRPQHKTCWWWVFCFIRSTGV